MALILWSLLNLVLQLGLFYFFVRAALLLNKHIGRGAALFFVLGMLTVGCGRFEAKDNNAQQNMLGPLPPGIPLGNSRSLQTIPLGGINKIQLLAEYWTNQGIVKPRGLYVVIAGLTFGHRWQPVDGTLTPEGARLHYTAILRHEWLLLGQPVFASVDEYTGVMPPPDKPLI
jgi:hypothetical protein